MSDGIISLFSHQRNPDTISHHAAAGVTVLLILQVAHLCEFYYSIKRAFMQCNLVLSSAQFKNASVVIFHRYFRPS